MAWLDNVGWPKVVLLLGTIVLAIGALVLFPGEAASLMTWIEDLIHHFVEFFRDLGGSQ